MSVLPVLLIRLRQGDIRGVFKAVLAFENCDISNVSSSIESLGEFCAELYLHFFLLLLIDPSAFSVNLLLLFTLGSRFVNSGGSLLFNSLSHNLIYKSISSDFFK